MDKRQKSRRQWEQELWNSQQNLTTEGQLRGPHHLARSKYGKLLAVIAGPKQLAQLLVGGVLVGAGIEVVPWNRAALAVLGIALIASGLLVIVKAIRWK